MSEIANQDGGPKDPVWDDYEGMEFVDEYEIMGYECMGCDSTQENPGDCNRCCGPTMPMYF